jgi:hypothetical protein
MPSFFDQIDDMLAEAEDRMGKHVKEVGKVLIGQLTDMPPIGTPIKTGFARANWVISMTGTKGRPNGAPTPGGVAIAQAAQKSSLAKFIRTPLEDLGTFYVVNAVDYLRDLNAGSSIQSPAMFVEEAVETTSIMSKHWRK